ncbi:MAG: DUF5916 domain-containing protein [Rhodothermales bacterium]
MSFATLLLVALLFVGTDAPSEERCPNNPSCTLTAQPVLGTISVDGHLDEPDWHDAPIASGFRQFEPHEGAEPSQRTEVRILYGTSALYIGATLFDDEPDKIMRTLGRRDEFNQADWFIASIDSYFDRKTAYHFAVNAAGVQVDGILTRRLDTSWDAVWDAAVRITPEGWIVEMLIPYSMLRFSEDVEQWGVNFRRTIPRSGETDEWALVTRAEMGSGSVAQYGILEGLSDIRPRRNVQITPYTLSRVLTEEGDPGTLQSTRTIDVGGDLKVGLSSNVTLDATINPDFGQVESDPAVLNLTAFETFFPERRPFFTEGVQIFNFNLERGGSLLYTRRIGRRAPIIGATKLSGRTGRGLSFGLFGAATGEDFDPNRLYGVARLQQQIGRFSSVGGMLTAYDYAGSSARRSFTGGLDWDLRSASNTYKFDGQISTTHRTQPGNASDPESGFSLTAGFDKTRGIWTFSSGITIISDDFNPNDLGRLRRNNYTNIFAGFAHQINGGDPFGPFRRASLRFFTGDGLSYREGLDLGLGFFFFSTWQFHGFQEIELNVNSDYLLGGYDVSETRGLGPRSKPRQISFRTSYETDSRRIWQLQPSARLELFGDGGRAYNLGMGAEWNVNARVNLSTRVGYGWDDGVTAWVSNEAFTLLEDGWGIGEASRRSPGPDDTFRAFDDQGRLDDIFSTVEPYDDLGRFFVPVFGERDTRSFDLTLRGDVTFSPTLSLQLYGQLFVARGRYDRFSVLRDRDTLSPLDSYPKQHDFAFSSFQTNTVLRWEYRPGSTLFIVWSQSRRGNQALDPFDETSHSPFDQRSTDQLLDTFDIFPTNVFLVKLSYKFLR